MLKKRLVELWFLFGEENGQKSDTLPSWVDTRFLRNLILLKIRKTFWTCCSAYNLFQNRLIGSENSLILTVNKKGCKLARIKEVMFRTYHCSLWSGKKIRLLLHCISSLTFAQDTLAGCQRYENTPQCGHPGRSLASLYGRPQSKWNKWPEEHW